MYEGRKLSLDDLACGDTACADLDPFDRTVKVDLNSLKVGLETTQGFTDDLGPGTARPLDLSASFIFYAGNDPFFADFTYFGHNSHTFAAIDVEIEVYCEIGFCQLLICTKFVIVKIHRWVPTQLKYL